MKNYLLAAALVVFVILFSGCATLFTTQVRMITIESDPPSAQVSDKNGNVLGTTPYTFTPTKAGKYNFLISKKGFEDNELSLRPVVYEKALWADAMLLCIPCIIDIPSQAYINYPRSKYTVDLRHSANAREEGHKLFSDNVYVNIYEPKIGLAEKEIIGKVNAATIKYNSSRVEETTGDPTFYTDALCSEFGRYNILSLRCGINKYEREGFEMLAPDKQLYIQADIKSWDFSLKQKSGRYTGSGNISINWKVLDPNQDKKCIYEAMVTTSSEFEERHLKYVFTKLLQKAADRFIVEDNIYELIKKQRLLTPGLLKGEEVGIDKIKNASFDNLKDLVNRCTKAVVTIKQKNGFGSGVIISQQGYILTNYHVVDDNSEVTVKFSSGMSMTAKVLKTNPAADLALLKVDAQELPALPFAGEAGEVGEEVIAIGTPGDLSLEQTVSKGIVSGKRVIDGKNFLQSDVSVNAGNSGGPLLNNKGEILGIISMKMVGRGVEGLGFALASDDIVQLLNLKIE